jgi:hypothetical protein
MKTKLPKQWLHWAQCAGLQPATVRGWRGFYLKGRGRRWRVNDRGHLQASCPNEHFDRWANSLGAEIFMLPKTRDQFLAAVRWLHKKSAHAR